MSTPDTIAALTALAEASTPGETLRALRHAEALLGEAFDAYRPLLETLTVRAQEVHKLQRLAGTDGLTGIANRRHFRETLDREVARHNRSGGELAVILLDLDDLKVLNDTHGHQAGDDAIRTIANCCTETLRRTDLVARLGGDEFAIIIPDGNDESVRICAERIRESIEEHSIAGRPLRVSIGFATAGRPPVSAEGILATADAHLYQDKRDRKQSTEQRAA